MKKIFTLALVSIMALAANAKDLFTGSQYVTWEQGLQLTADKFADANSGDKLVITYTGATGSINFNVMDNFNRLPGSCWWCPIQGDGTLEQFLTNAAVAKLKASGLEMKGDFTVKKVELLPGKDNVTDNTVWTGYFWVDSWTTLELVMTSFDGINWADYTAIRFYSEAGRTDYTISVRTSWEPEGLIADNSSMTMTNEYAELSLNGINIAAKLNGVNQLMIQGNKDNGAAFNLTSIELVPTTVGIESVAVNVATNGKAFNLAGQQVSTNAKGLVIVNGKKMLNK